ncbi:hypothetical protein CEXT_696371 [Caerostris extrusa]|uniref:Uncharacterized protein n=1 Tax=Caerostris extrusa TaxID=172846 RepID=A0AAV4YBB5_CAEEX|nr:hypothetical protein CEXT_696371 [Caerostris extrusa]
MDILGSVVLSGKMGASPDSEKPLRDSARGESLQELSLSRNSCFLKRSEQKQTSGGECRVTSAAECVAMMDGLREFVNNLRSSPRSLLDAPTPVRSPPPPHPQQG